MQMRESHFSNSAGSFHHSSATSGASSNDVALYSKCVDLPPFVGDNPVGWLAKAETYFSVQNTPSETCISLAQICMEGKTWHWFKFLSNFDPNLHWDSFK
ncbi:hypothetical protein AAZX31_19G140700 [Glycine max]